MVTVLCAALFLGSIAATCAWCRGSWFNPLTAFFGVWTLNVALYELDSVFEVFNVRLNDLAESMLSLSLICVFLGTCIGFMTGLFGVREERLEVNGQILDRMQTIAVAMFMVFATGVVWRYWLAVTMYGPLLDNLAAIRAGVYVGDLSIPTANRLMTL